VNTCPKCGKELLSFEYHGIELLKCFECKGFWFKDGKFRETKQIGFSELVADIPAESDSEPSSESSPDEQKMMCPDCEEPLVAFMYAYSSDIPLHRCPRCRGIWAYSADLLCIEELLTGYNESLEDAKFKALPLMLKVKEQVQQEEQARKQEQKRKKKRGLFNRLSGPRRSTNRTLQDILKDFEKEEKSEERDP
jgi:Zn-finger nucleic acid-binding protein